MPPGCIRMMACKVARRQPVTGRVQTAGLLFAIFSDSPGIAAVIIGHADRRFFAGACGQLANKAKQATLPELHSRYAPESSAVRQLRTWNHSDCNLCIPSHINVRGVKNHEGGDNCRNSADHSGDHRICDGRNKLHSSEEGCGHGSSANLPSENEHCADISYTEYHLIDCRRSLSCCRNAQ